MEATPLEQVAVVAVAMYRTGVVTVELSTGLLTSTPAMSGIATASKGTARESLTKAHLLPISNCIRLFRIRDNAFFTALDERSSRIASVIGVSPLCPFAPALGFACELP
jgi:hypothetical protein